MTRKTTKVEVEAFCCLNDLKTLHHRTAAVLLGCVISPMP